MNTWSKAQDALLVQWGICFGPGGWDLLAPIVGCRSEESFNIRLVVVLFIDVDTMNFVQNTSPVFCSHAIKQGNYVLRCRKWFQISLRTIKWSTCFWRLLPVPNGSNWCSSCTDDLLLHLRIVMCRKYLERSPWLKKSIAMFPMFVYPTCINSSLSATVLASHWLQRMSLKRSLKRFSMILNFPRRSFCKLNIRNSLVDGHLLEAIDHTISSEDNTPFPGNTKVFSVHQYRKLKKSLQLLSRKRTHPDPSEIFKSRCSNHIIHVNTPIQKTRSKIRFVEFPLVSTPGGVIPLSYLRSSIAASQLHDCGYVKVPLYELLPPASSKRNSSTETSGQLKKSLRSSTNENRGPSSKSGSKARRDAANSSNDSQLRRNESQPIFPILTQTFVIHSAERPLSDPKRWDAGRQWIRKCSCFS